MISSLHCIVSACQCLKILQGDILLVSLDGMQIDVICYEPQAFSLRPVNFFFQPLHWFSQLRSCFIEWDEKKWSIMLCINNAIMVVMKLLIYFIYILWCFTWSKNKHKQSLESAQCRVWRSSLKVQDTHTWYCLCMWQCVFVFFYFSTWQCE